MTARLLPLSAALACTLALAACGGGDDRDPRAPRDDTDAALPAPARNSGSVTGMPDDRGPGDVPITGAPPPPPPEPLSPEQFGMPSTLDNPEAGFDGSDPVGGDGAAGKPTLADAEALVDAYYAAIAAGNLPAAYAMWSDDGRASGQTAEQFANGFAQTTGTSVQRGASGPVEGAAGSRFVEIPVSVTSTRSDGSTQRFLGCYVLRRAVVDGADAGRRAWRIESADLRPVE